MLRDITIGRYVERSSALHRLDARSKIIGALICSILTLACSSFFSMAAIAALTAAAALISHIPFNYILKGLKPIRWFILFTVIVNLISVGGTAVWQWSVFCITAEGINAAALIAARLILFFSSTSLLTLTTPPISLTDGFARLMRPLRHLRIPVDDIAMMISITLRSIPAFADEADRIMKAQRARGADFSHGGLIARAKAIMPVTIPLFISVFRRADELSLAMDARCYGKGTRTPRKKARFGRNDLYAFIIMILFCGFLAIIEFYN